MASFMSVQGGGGKTTPSGRFSVGLTSIQSAAPNTGRNTKTNQFKKKRNLTIIAFPKNSKSETGDDLSHFFMIGNMGSVHKSHISLQRQYPAIDQSDLGVVDKYGRVHLGSLVHTVPSIGLVVGLKLFSVEYPLTPASEHLK